MILERYIEQIQKKSFGKMDIRLLEVLGFKDSIRILTEERTKMLAYEKQMERRANIDGGIVSEPGDYQYHAGSINVLGSGFYEAS